MNFLITSHLRGHLSGLKEIVFARCLSRCPGCSEPSVGHSLELLVVSLLLRRESVSLLKAIETVFPRSQKQSSCYSRPCTSLVVQIIIGKKLNLKRQKGQFILRMLECLRGIQREKCSQASELTGIRWLGTNCFISLNRTLFLCSLGANTELSLQKAKGSCSCSLDPLLHLFFSVCFIVSFTEIMAVESCNCGIQVTEDTLGFTFYSLDSQRD